MPAHDPRKQPGQGQQVQAQDVRAEDMRDEDLTTQTPRTIMTIAQGLGQVLTAHRGERHIVVLQDFPDPDALASAYAHQLISAIYDIQVDIVHTEQISHVQNVALVRLVGMNVIRWNPAADLRKYQAAVFIDNQGTTAVRLVEALEKTGVPALMVIDHHELQERLQPKFSDIQAGWRYRHPLRRVPCPGPAANGQGAPRARARRNGAHAWASDRHAGTRPSRRGRLCGGGLP